MHSLLVRTRASAAVSMAKTSLMMHLEELMVVPLDAASQACHPWGKAGPVLDRYHAPHTADAWLGDHLGPRDSVVSTVSHR